MREFATLFVLALALLAFGLSFSSPNLYFLEIAPVQLVLVAIFLMGGAILLQLERVAAALESGNKERTELKSILARLRGRRLAKNAEAQKGE